MQTESYYGSDQQRLDLRNTVEYYAGKLHDKEVSYRGSWQKREGIGAFMMLARKADRLLPIIEAIKENWEKIENHAREQNYDVFKVWEACQLQCDSELNDIHDLWGYLTLVITEMEVVRPRRLAQQHAEDSKSIVLPDGSIGANPRYPNEIRLTESEWKTLEKTGSVKLGDGGGILFRITRENILNDDYLGSPQWSIDRQPEYEFVVVDDPVQPIGNSISHAPASAAEVLQQINEANPDLEDEELSPSLASHPFHYPSAGNQCPKCNATSPKSTGDECTCRQCGEKFPKKIQDVSAFDQKFPQAMIMRGKNAPETDTIVKG
jgi:hypothetical protein